MRAQGKRPRPDLNLEMSRWGARIVAFQVIGDAGGLAVAGRVVQLRGGAGGLVWDS